MGWCLQSIFLMLLACHRKKLWPKTFFITACKFSDSSSKYYVIACKFWGSWHENFETLPSVSHPVHSKYVIPTTDIVKLGMFSRSDMFVYDNFRRNLNKCWVILATENLLTTKVTCEFLVNTVLPLICC